MVELESYIRLHTVTYVIYGYPRLHTVTYVQGGRVTYVTYGYIQLHTLHTVTHGYIRLHTSKVVELEIALREASAISEGARLETARIVRELKAAAPLSMRTNAPAAVLTSAPLAAVPRPVPFNASLFVSAERAKGVLMPPVSHGVPSPPSPTSPPPRMRPIPSLEGIAILETVETLEMECTVQVRPPPSIARRLRSHDLLVTAQPCRRAPVRSCSDWLVAHTMEVQLDGSSHDGAPRAQPSDYRYKAVT